MLCQDSVHTLARRKTITASQFVQIFKITVITLVGSYLLYKILGPHSVEVIFEIFVFGADGT